jgi:hypothetical protein
VVKLTVVHDDFEPGSAVLEAVTNGWPRFLANLKTLLERARPGGQPSCDVRPPSRRRRSVAGYRQPVSDGSPSSQDQVGAAEVIAALSLATDLGMGLPLEHGLHSTVIAMRLCARLGVDAETASQVYYACLLFYVGCTADAEVQADLFDDGALLAHFTPVMFGSRGQTMRGIMRALAAAPASPPLRVAHAVARLPRAVGTHTSHVAALCEVAQMLTDRLGLPGSVRDLFVHLTERWDGKGEPGRLRGEQIPLALRVVHVARDAAFQRLVGGDGHAVRVVRERAGHAFDPRSRRSSPATRRRSWHSTRTPRPGMRRSQSSPSPGCGWPETRSSGRSPRWASSPTCCRRPLWATPAAWPIWPRRPLGDAGGRRRGFRRYAGRPSCTTWGAWRSRSASGRRPGH